MAELVFVAELLTAVSMYVYYCRTYASEKAVSGGPGGDSESLSGPGQNLKIPARLYFYLLTATLQPLGAGMSSSCRR